MTYRSQHHLSQVDLKRLVSTAQSSPLDDTPAMNELIRRFEPLALRLARGIRSADHHLRDDLANAARLALVKAVRRHNGGMGFPGYAKAYMHGAVLREFGRWIVPETLSIDAVDSELDHRSARHETADVLDRLAPWGTGDLAVAVENLDASQVRLVKLRYIDGARVKEIADAAGTSGPAVSQRLATIHRKMASAVAT